MASSQDDLKNAFVLWIQNENNGDVVWEFCQAHDLTDEVLNDPGVRDSVRYFDGSDSREAPKSNFLIAVQTDENWAEAWAEDEEVFDDWKQNYSDGAC